MGLSSIVLRAASTRSDPYVSSLAPIELSGFVGGVRAYNRDRSQDPNSRCKAGMIT